MSEKVLNTRIQLKYDSYANWTKKGTWSDGKFTPSESVETTFWEGFVPRAGEVIFFAVPQSTSEVSQEPAILFKVGNGETTLKNLPWGSAIAADVYAWAKKQYLEWGDLSNDFTTALQEFVEAHSVNDTYSIVETSVGSNIFQLQKTDKDGASTPVGSQIDLADIYSRLNKKVNRLLENPDGSKALIFNEADGGGAKFEYTDGTASYVGVHDKSNGVGAQIYVDKDATTGVIIDVTGDKAYYHKGEFGTATTRDVPENEIATIGDIQLATHEYTIVKQETTEETYLATYNLTKDGVNVGASINIPKDFLVKSAEIKTVTEAGVPYAGAEVGDKYIDFVINTKDGSETDEHLYLPVKELVDVYTAGNGIVIDNSNVISTKAVRVKVKDGEELQQANVPVYFDIEPAADKVTVNSYSIKLGGEDDQTATKYSMDVPCATTTTAGLMSAADKSKLDASVTEVTAGDGISVTTTETTREVSVKLDDTTSKIGTEEAHSGLATSANGLKIDESLTWIFNCGSASEFMN